MKPDPIQKALTNPMICGYPCRRYRTMVTKRGERRPVLLPREQWVWPEQTGQYPVACTREQWERIQLVLQQRWSLKGKSGFDELGWARDVLLFRGYSERPRLSARYRSPGQTTLTYELDRRITRGTVYIRRDLVHSAIEKALCAALTGSGAASALGQASRVTHSLEASRTGSHAVLEGIRQQLEEQRQQLADLMRLWAEADEEERLAIRATQGAVKRRLADLKRELQAAQGPALPSLDLTELIPHLTILAEDWEGVWSETPGSIKRQVVRACVAEVEAIAEPAPGRTPWRREVGEVRIRDWLRGW